MWPHAVHYSRDAGFVLGLLANCVSCYLPAIGTELPASFRPACCSRWPCGWCRHRCALVKSRRTSQLLCFQPPHRAAPH